MVKKRNELSNRRRSRPVKKQSLKTKFKRNKSAIFLAIFIVFMMVFASFYVAFSGTNSDDSSVHPKAIIKTTMGEITIELFDDKLPDTCENFITLSNQDYYKGIVFHRVANIYPEYPDRYIIQSGGFDSDGNPKGINIGNIDFETHPDVTHTDGAISMASTDAGVGGSTQFFICNGDHHFLDGKYAAFGKVIDGMDVVESISDAETKSKTLSTGQTMQYWPKEDILINDIEIIDE